MQPAAAGLTVLAATDLATRRVSKHIFLAAAIGTVACSAFDYPPGVKTAYDELCTALAVYDEQPAQVADDLLR